MSRLGNLIINVGANTKEFNKALGDVNRGISRTTGNIQKMGKELSMAVTLPLAALGVTAVQAFDKQAKAIAQVEAGLKSTGNAVGFTSKQLQSMASDLQRTTLFGDEDILQGVTSQLLTFTNLAGDQFARTQKAALDLATRLDGDLKGASIQLGKALNDPVKNLSALSRSGIQFSEDQKTVIKSLTETGRLAEAQTLILDELEKQYGGSAEAAAKAGTGGIKQLQNAFGDLQEEFGKIIVDFLPPIIDGMKNLITWFQGTSDTVKGTIVAISAIAAAAGPLLLIIPNLVKGFALLRVGLLQGVIPAVMKLNAVLLANPYLLAAAAVAGLTAGIYSLVTAQTAAEELQGRLSQKMEQAGKDAGAQMAEVLKLKNAVEDETKAEDERREALEKLKKISPEYFGQLDMEKVKMGELTNAVDAYKRSLLEAARVKALQAQLEEVTAELLAIEQGAKKSGSTFAQAIAWMVGDSEGLQDRLTKNSRKALEEQQQFLLNQLAGTKEAVDETAAASNNFAQSLITVGEDAATTKDELDDLTYALQQIYTLAEDPLSIDLKLRKKRQDMEGGPRLEQIDEVDTGEDWSTEDIEQWAQSIDDAKERMRQFHAEQQEQLMVTTHLATSLGDSFGNMFGSIIDGTADATEAFKGFIKQTIKQLIGIARMNIIATYSSPTNPANLASGGLATPAIIAGGLAMLEGLVGAIPFADGGIVSGPTLGLMGEYTGARTNPEVIAPLDKLKSMLDEGGTRHIEVTGRISGNDIVLIQEKGRNFLRRSRG